MNPTRFPGGITNAYPTDNLRNMGQLDPTKFITFFDDLLVPAAALGTFTAVSGNGGLVTVATTNSLTTPQTSFILDDSKRFFAKAKFAIAAKAQAAVVGFADDLSSVGAGVTVALDNGNLILTVDGSSVTTETVAVDYDAATQVTIGFEYIPNVGVFGYLNDVAVASIRDTSNLDTTTAMEAGIYSDGSTLTVDYILAAAER